MSSLYAVSRDERVIPEQIWRKQNITWCSLTTNEHSCPLRSMGTKDKLNYLLHVLEKNLKGYTLLHEMLLSNSTSTAMSMLYEYVDG